MSNNNLKDKLNEIKSLIVANSKDAHWAKNAVDELLSVKGQLDHEPTILHLPLSGVENTMKSDTFELHEMKDGTAVYHVYGGYTVVADSRITSLNSAIKEYIAADELSKGLTEEEKEQFALSLSAFGYVMSCPMFAFSDATFTFEIASKIVEFLRESSEKILNEELIEENQEDVELNERFKDATLAIEELKEEVQKVVKG